MESDFIKKRKFMQSGDIMLTFYVEQRVNVMRLVKRRKISRSLHKISRAKRRTVIVSSLILCIKPRLIWKSTIETTKGHTYRLIRIKFRFRNMNQVGSAGLLEFLFLNFSPSFSSNHNIICSVSGVSCTAEKVPNDEIKCKIYIWAFRSTV
jgi:hypothetical protein